MTFPGISMTKWVVRCKEEGIQRGFLRTNEIPYLQVSPKANGKRRLFIPLLLVRFWLVERAGMSDAAEVLVQELREVVNVPIYEPLVPIFHEF